SNSGFWNFSLKIGTSSRTMTSFPCRSVLVRLIVIGLVGGAAGVTGKFAIGADVGHGPDVGLGGVAVIHSRIDLAGSVGPARGVAAGAAAGAGPAAGAGLGVVNHS